MRTCSCSDTVHDLDTPEGMFEHILAPVALMPPEAQAAYRTMFAATLVNIAPLMNLICAVVVGDHALVGLCVAQAKEGALRLAHDIRRAEDAARALETRRWMREAEGKR